MLVYCVTTVLEKEIEKVWVQWMRKVHLSEMLATGKFTKALLYKKQTSPASSQVTYCAEYFTPDQETLQRYYKENAAALRKGTAVFKDQATYTRSEFVLLEEKKAPAA